MKETVRRQWVVALAVQVVIAVQVIAGVLVAPVVLAQAPSDTSGAGAAADERLGDRPCLPEVEPNDRPEQAPSLSGEICLSGTLIELEDQDLFFWDVAPEDGITTWSFTMRGVPATITSAHVFPLPDPVVFPIVDVTEVFRADSDAHLGTGPVITETRLAPGHYLVGISRGYAGYDQELTDDLGYELRIDRAGSLPPLGDVEPNDDATTATPVSGAFELSGDAGGSADAFRWTLSGADAARFWRLEAVTSIGTALHVALTTGDAEPLVATDVAPDGSAAIHDLRLPAGSYVVRLSGNLDEVQPYRLQAVAVTDQDIDPEPNDSVALAIPIDPAALAVRGRVAAEGDVDRYLLDVDAALAGQHLDISLTWSDGSYRTFCLSTEAGTSMGCPTAEGSAALPDLVLPEGRYRLDVRGTPSLDDRYELRVTPGAAVAADLEAEPNDAADTATRWDPTIVMHGSASSADVDTYRVHVDTEPTLWRLDAAGTSIHSLSWLRPDRTPMGAPEISADGSEANIEDLYLIRGDHLVAIQADGDYELVLTEQGSPAAGAELEPNDDSGHAETLRFDSTRTGRLPTMGDWDLYRFTLMAPEHLVLRLEPPAEADIDMTLWYGLEPVVGQTARQGQALEHDLVLVPGAYEIQLHATAPSREAYSLSLERADPFVLTADQEPNDSIGEAHPLPPTLEVHGAARTSPDEDWYQLPSLSAPGGLRIRAAGEEVSVNLTDGSQSYDLILQSDGLTYAADGLPAGLPLYLDVTTWADYDLAVSSDGLVPAPEPPVELSFQTDTGSVAAFLREGQGLTGTLSIHSGAATDLGLAIDGVASQWDWKVLADPDEVSVPAGGAVSVPIAIEVPPDAWSEDPVRVTVRARDGRGGQRTAFVDVVVDPYAEPVGPGSIWSVPKALLGGLNVASGALGGVCSGPSCAMAVGGATVEPEPEKALFDGVTADGAGFTIPYTTPLLPDIDVDLAGDASLPIAGTILHPEGVVWTLGYYPREFDLLLSEDGESWQVALTGELQPIAVDQAFAMPSPVDARFARLRIRSMHGTTPGLLSLAEWKVVAAPGAAPSADALDIADPKLGGHIVWMDPWNDRGVLERILDADLTREWTGDTSGEALTFVVGFKDDRAAEITELRWVDPEGSDPAARIDSVDVAVSVDSPLGPWRSLGTWSLDRAADGIVAPLALPSGTWARYVKLTAPIPATAVEIDTLELPGTLRVIERAVDDGYRSVFGEWGDGRPSGPFEWLTPPSAPPVGPDAGDTPETATPLSSGVTLHDRVQFSADEDWYALTVPEGQDTLSVSIGAQPATAVELMLQNPEGTEVPIMPSPGTADSARWFAVVQPGETYGLRVRQPPFSSVITFDVSGSLSSWVPRIMGALRTFTAGVEPGREAVMIVPFEEAPLLKEWSDQPDALRAAVDAWHGGVSSAAVTALLDATRLLEDRTGIHAIFVIHDAEDVNSYLTLQLWQAFARVRPVVFSVLVSSIAPPTARYVFEDWANANGGFYQYASTQADMDRAFDRMATWLRRPAAYGLSYETSFVDYPPGRLSVVPVEGAAVPVGGGVSLELVLDTSGSMNKKLGGVTRMAVAREVLTRLVDEALPEGLPVALRTFKAGNGSCRTVLPVPFGPLDRAAMGRVIAGLRINRETRTPLGAALHAVGDDLAGRPGPKIVVFVTDGKETCKGDPAAEVERLVELGVDVTMNIVGFALEDPALKADMEAWAASGGGVFFDAQDQEGLLAGISAALRAPYRVYDAAGDLVAEGVVGGPALELPPGAYRVEVLSAPPVTFEDVTLAPGDGIRLEVGASTD